MNENINKIVYGTSTLIDLTEDTVSPSRMYKGDIAHDASGAEITGTAEVTVEGKKLIMPEGLITPIGTVDSEDNWIRPTNWPDLDSLYNNETNTLWITIDATGRIPDPHISIAFTGATTIQVGSIQNNVFVADSTESVATNTTWTKVWEPASNFYPIIKIVGTGNITTYSFKAWTSTAGRNYVAQYQAVVEWIGHLNKISSATRIGYFTEREKIKITNCTTDGLRYRWNCGYCLQELNVSDWDTSSWALTNLSVKWQYCINLTKLDLSNWNTSNWAVTTLSNTWDCCHKLKKLDLSHWNTSNWAVINMAGTWYECNNLETLNIKNWNTSNWKVTSSMTNTWNNCFKLKELDLSNWDTSDWSVTDITTTWQYCLSLKKLNLTGWDTSKWTIAAAASYPFRCCSSLVDLDFSWFDISKIKAWRTSTLGFELDISLQNLTFGTSNNGKMDTSTTYPSIRFDACVLLTHDSILNIFNALKNGVSDKTLQLGTANLNKMTDAEKAIATNKGWTLTS